MIVEDDKMVCFRGFRQHFKWGPAVDVNVGVSPEVCSISSWHGGIVLTARESEVVPYRLGI